MSSLNVGTITLSSGLTLPVYTSSPDTRPTHSVGRTIFDNTSGTIQVSDGSSWISAGTSGGGLISATGGEISFDGNYKVHTFYDPGQYNFNVTGAAAGASAEVLVVAGGGAGGTIGGGGGGGGVCHHSSYPLSVGAYDVVVGAGGVAPMGGYATPKGVPGGDSEFGNHTAYGGGPGGAWSGSTNEQGTPGGSGGGGTGPGPDAQGGSATQGIAPGGSVYGNAGYAGGNLTSGTHSGTHTGGGGGGAGGSSNGRVGGNGITIMGYTVGGGGGGGSHQQYGSYTTTTPATPGGGGRGASNQSQFAGGGPLGFGEPAVPNTGGGGGGGWYNGGGTGQGGAGGSGIVVVRHTI